MMTNQPRPFDAPLPADQPRRFRPNTTVRIGGHEWRGYAAPSEYPGYDRVWLLDGLRDADGHCAAVVYRKRAKA